jgi:hypothetical protein
MIQRRDRARFPLEALGELGGGNFDRNGALQPRIARLVHLAHAAFADGRKDLMGPRRVPTSEMIVCAVITSIPSIEVRSTPQIRFSSAFRSIVGSLRLRMLARHSHRRWRTRVRRWGTLAGLIRAGETRSALFHRFFGLPVTPHWIGATGVLDGEATVIGTFHPVRVVCQNSFAPPFTMV